jgi:uncharacterized protein (TIGR02246 family)
MQSGTQLEQSRLQDLEEIRALSHAYARHLDGGDLRAYAGLFAADGEWVGGFGSARGPGEIERLVQGHIAERPAGSSAIYHVLGDILVEFSSADAATGRMTWMAVAHGDDGAPTIQKFGFYEDSYVREDGSWRFGRRLAQRLIPTL